MNGRPISGAGKPGAWASVRGSIRRTPLTTASGAPGASSDAKLRRSVPPATYPRPLEKRAIVPDAEKPTGTIGAAAAVLPSGRRARSVRRTSRSSAGRSAASAT